MEPTEIDNLLFELSKITDRAYEDTFESLFKKTKKELENALSFIELQKSLIESSRTSGIHSCLCEIRVARSVAPRDSHIYFDELINVIEHRIRNDGDA